MRMITTIDNPWNPFDNFDEWLQYDQKMGYYTNEALASLCISSDDALSDAELEDDTYQAMLKLVMDGAIAKDGSRTEYVIVDR